MTTSPTPNTSGQTDFQRLMWLVLAMVALSIPLWYEIALQPSTYVFAWRWTEQQVLVESIVSVLHLVVVVAGIFMLKRAVGDMAQWPLIRVGAWIWAALVGLLALFAIVMYQVSDDTVLESIEGQGYKVNIVRSGSDVRERTQVNVVLSCNHTLLYKNMLYVDRLAGVNQVRVEELNDSLTIGYLWQEAQRPELVSEETYDLTDFYERCRQG